MHVEMNLALGKNEKSIIRTEPFPEGIRKQYEREDKDPKQEIDWTDRYQRECETHNRSYHIKCEACYP